MSKEQFRQLCEQREDIPLFLSYDWNNTVVPEEDWGVLFSGDPGDPKGFLVYYLKQKYGFKKITHPPLTPYSGPWVFYPQEQKQAQRYGYEKKVMDELIEGLPPYDDLQLHLHPSITNWLPFYWKGFNETLRYSYQIETSEGLEAIHQGLRSNIRRAIRKAEKSSRVEEGKSVDPLHDLKIKDYKEKGIALSYDRAFFQKIDETLAPHGKRKVLYALDAEGAIHGGIYLVLTPRTCYYLVGAVDPDTKSEGTMSLLMWKGIEEATNQGLVFDFEGSMIEPIERFFRSFGAFQTPYHHLRRTPSLLLRGKKAFDLLRA